jgi:hypothetical protein
VRLEVIFPWRGGCDFREAAWRWVEARYRGSFPGLPLARAEAPAGPWRKGCAVADAVRRSAADIIAIADADVWSLGLPAAFAEVADGAPWAMPHTRLYRLSPEGTSAVLSGGRWEDQPLDQRAYRGLDGGGVVVASREVLMAIPIDPRFEGWGQEDEAWAFALGGLLGPVWRADFPMVHLWHPPQPRASRRHGSRENWQLRRRYLRARRDPRAMSALIEEAHEHFGSSDPALQDGGSNGVGRARSLRQ